MRFQQKCLSLSTEKNKFGMLMLLLSLFVLSFNFGVSEVKLNNLADEYSSACSVNSKANRLCQWCHREIPAKQGMWRPFAPYWQYLGKCSNQAFTEADSAKCLSGRTIYVIGDSFVRQTAYNLMEVLNGTNNVNEDICPKRMREFENSCSYEINGVTVKYLYLQFFDGFDYHDRGGFPYFRYNSEKVGRSWITGKLIKTNVTNSFRPEYHNKPTDLDAAGDFLWHYDNCAHTDIRQCLSTFLKDSKSNDVLIFTLGRAYANDRITAADGDEPTISPSIDYKEWLLHSAIAFKEHIHDTFKGQVFRVTMAEYSKSGYLAPQNKNLAKVNELLYTVWAPPSLQYYDSTEKVALFLDAKSAEDRPWYTIDQWAINSERYDLYDSAVYYNGRLSLATVYQVLNELCPGEGTAKSDIFVAKVMVSKHAAAYYVVYNGEQHHVPDMDTLDGLDLTSSHFIDYHSLAELNALYPVAEPLVRCDKTWIPNTCKDSVYYKSFHSI